jgi:hypothetical protein
MTETPLPLTNGFYVSRSKPISAQQCSNMYVQAIQSGMAPEALFGTPGLTQLTTTGGRKHANRGSRVMGGIPYFVQGGWLYSLDRTVSGDIETFSTALLGNISGSGRVSMADNGTQLMILVPGGTGYIYTVAGGLVQITDADFDANGNPQYVVYIDGYFVCTTDSKKFIVSALNDGMSWNALDFGSAEADPDDIVAPLVHRNQLFIGGSETIEAFQNIGGTDFPFQRVQGFVMDSGIDAPLSIVNAHGTFYCIGGDVNETPQIMAFDGSRMVPISSDGIDLILQDLSPEELGQVYGFSYSDEGARFVGWVLPDTCLVYEKTTQKWHERKSQVTTIDGVGNSRWRVQSLVTAYNRVIVADYLDGRIGVLSPDTYTDYGTEILRDVATMPFSNNSKSISFPWIELTVESGVGNAAAPDPKITMTRSLDGKTWTAPRIRSLGRLGEYGHRVMWRRNGRAERFEIFRFQMSDPVRPVFIKLEADVVG